MPKFFFLLHESGRELKATTTIVIIIIKREPFSPPCLVFSTYFESDSSFPSSLVLFFFSCFQGRMQAYIVGYGRKMRDDLELYVKGLPACLR